MRTTNTILKLTLGIFLMTTVVALANNEKPLTIENPIELNKEYIDLVYNNADLDESKFLSRIVSEWDVRSSKDFDERDQEYTVLFRTNKGEAYAHYDNDGRLVRVQKKFENVALPTEILTTIATIYEGWTHVGNKYRVTYSKGRDVSRVYELHLENGDSKKRVRLEM